MKVKVIDLIIILIIYYQVNSIVMTTQVLDENNTDITISDKNKNTSDIFIPPVIIDGSNRIPYQNNNNNSKMSWINVTIITVLIVIIIYVAFYLFRYYRKKKYQNPSFYYKITEELFDDITPIE